MYLQIRQKSTEFIKVCYIFFFPGENRFSLFFGKALESHLKIMYSVL